MVVEHAGPSRRTGLPERATALVLVPAMLLVFIVLAAIALDLSAVAGAQRGVERVASAAVDDAAGMLDGRQHQLDGSVRIDRERAQRYVLARIEAAHIPGRVVDADVRVTDTTVDALLRVETPHLFLRAVPGMSDRVLSSPIRVRARLHA